MADNSNKKPYVFRCVADNVPPPPPSDTNLIFAPEPIAHIPKGAHGTLGGEPISMRVRKAKATGTPQP